MLAVKGKVQDRTGHESPEVEYMYRSILALTLALDGGGWSTTRPGRFTPGKEPIPNYGRLGRPHGRCGRVRIFRTVQPEATRYTDRAIVAHSVNCTKQTTKAAIAKSSNINIAEVCVVLIISYLAVSVEALYCHKGTWGNKADSTGWGLPLTTVAERQLKLN
jgi:hypothetical protein